MYDSTRIQRAFYRRLPEDPLEDRRGGGGGGGGGRSAFPRFDIKENTNSNGGQLDRSISVGGGEIGRHLVTLSGGAAQGWPLAGSPI